MFKESNTCNSNNYIVENQIPGGHLRTQQSWDLPPEGESSRFRPINQRLCDCCNEDLMPRETKPDRVQQGDDNVTHPSLITRRPIGRFLFSPRKLTKKQSIIPIWALTKPAGWKRAGISSQLLSRNKFQRHFLKKKTKERKRCNLLAQRRRLRVDGVVRLTLSGDLASLHWDISELLRTKLSNLNPQDVCVRVCSFLRILVGIHTMACTDARLRSAKIESDINYVGT